ncbi:uncharacterized protein [Littorina saxatilis]|uniref:RING-type domain-containing protein n=1 Tax=Littorina saxatilis TaxID=31220 RepID=A0AAN9AWW3_9CAEN
MLNSVLIVGVPMVALIAAAFYIYRRTQTEMGTHGPGGGAYNREPWGMAAANNRQSATNPRRRNTRTRKEANDSNNSQRSRPYESPDSSYPDEDQCEICFEDVAKVQLYPCKHSDICETCVNKLLISNKRECPFCRARIDGYVEIQTGTMFG